MTDEKELGQQLLAESGLDRDHAQSEHDSQIQAMLGESKKKLRRRNRDTKWLWRAFLAWPVLVVIFCVTLFGHMFQLGVSAWVNLIAGGVLMGWVFILPLALYCTAVGQLANRDMMMAKIQTTLSEIADTLAKRANKSTPSAAAAAEKPGGQDHA